MEARYDDHHSFPRNNTRTVIQATAPHVNTCHDHSVLLVSDCEINARVLDLQRCLPGRSCGLFGVVDPSDPEPYYFEHRISAPLVLSHSSLLEFLGDEEIWTLLTQQAGDNFNVDEAIAVGRMADLVYDLEKHCDLDFQATRSALVETLFSVEMTEISTGLAQVELLSCFDKLLGRVFKSYTLPLADTLEIRWDPLYEGHLKKHCQVSPSGRLVLEFSPSRTRGCFW